MEMPKPTPGHLRLAQLAGQWEGQEIMHPSQWDPKGGTAVGRSSSRVALGGFALIADYEQERDGAITFAGHSVMVFDREREQYALHWFDCMGTPPEVFVGRFDGDRLTVAHGGPGMHARLTYEVADPERMLSKMEMSRDGVSWATLFEGNYERR